MKKKKKNKPFVMSVAVVIAVSLSISEDSKAMAVETTNAKKVEMPVYQNLPFLIENTYGVPIQTSFNEFSPQMKSILTYVKKAERSQSGEDIYLTQLLVDKLPESERIVVTERLNHIQPTSFTNTIEAVALAEKEVTLAEKEIHNDNQLKKAQKSVNDLFMSKERIDLVERLYAIHTELIKERKEKYK